MVLVALEDDYPPLGMLGRSQAVRQRVLVP